MGLRSSKSRPISSRRNFKEPFLVVDVPVICTHYKNDCSLVCPNPMCLQKYPCRLCHDEHVKGHKLEHYNVQKIICNTCQTEQEVSETCVECRVVFGRYFCKFCNLFDDRYLDYYHHCFACGECHTGHPTNYFHCEKCASCFSLDLLNSHSCFSNNSTMEECPICLDDMSWSSEPSVSMTCGHKIHAKCYEELKGTEHENVCPLCRQLCANLDER